MKIHKWIQPRFKYRLLRTLISFLLGLLLLSGIPFSIAQTWAQEVEAPAPQEAPASSADAAPADEVTPANEPGITGTLFPGIRDLLITEGQNIVRGVVRLDGHRLFAIAAPTIQDGFPESEALIPLEQRIEIIENRLQAIAESEFDPDALDVVFEIVPNSPQAVIYARTAEENAFGLIMTVTELDLLIHGRDIERLAADFSDIIENALLRARRERQPGFMEQQGLIASGILLAILLISWAIAQFQRRLQSERQILATQARAEAIHLNTDADEADSTLTAALLQQNMANRQRQNVNDIERRLAQIAQAALWGGGLFFVLGLFPNTRPLQPIVTAALRIPLRILAVILGTYVVIRISAVLVDRLFWILHNSASLAPNASQRLTLRFSTFSGVVKTSLAVVLLVIGGIIALSLIGLDVGPILAGAGIIGLGISFASQSLIKDIINGFLILLEDQYGVGDVIIVGEVSGFVEHVNLRITQLRNEEGRLITIPNGSITVVQNLSKEWSRVDLQIRIGHNSNLDTAIALIEQTARDMSRERHWKDLILEPPLMLGVDALDHTGALVRLWIKTQPLKQWEVAREYRRRLKLAFDEAGITIGIPQQVLQFGSTLDLKNPDLKNSDLKNPDLKNSVPTDGKRDF